MEIAILVFFIAIFGGVLFLLGLIWFIFRRVRKSRSGNRNFSSSSNYGSGYNQSHHRNFMDSDNDDAAAIYAGSSLLDNQDSVNTVVTETAHDSAYQSDNSYSHESHGSSAVPMETSYTESSSYSSSDSSSSYDSSSSSDSGSSSSDSGSSSSSSD